MSPASEEAEDALARAWEAFDEGDLEGALALADEVGDAHHGAWIVRASSWTELGELASARSALDRAQVLGGCDPTVLAWTSAELLLREWRIEDARAAYERVLAEERTPIVLARLSLCSELSGDLEGADRLMGEAARLDPQGWPLPPRLDAGEFERVLDEAIAQLPAPFQDALEDTQILIESVPRRELLDLSAPEETPPDLLGLFLGPALPERSVDDAMALPPTILLFQRNLERASADREELVSEIRVTLYHEIGHMLGFDEEGVEGLGLE